MGFDIDRTTLLLGSGAALVSALLGYMVGKRQRPLRRSLKRDESALIKYTKKHSMRLTPIQEQLREKTKLQIRAGMLGAEDQLQFLANVCKCINARKTLDIGVFTGYSALTIAMALPEDGRVVACDVSQDYADVGRPFWREAGVEDKIDLRIAPAIETLESLVKAGESGTYDFAFIDADKNNYDNYYELCLQLLRSGGVIALDNTLWSGRVLDEKTEEEDTKNIQEIAKKIHSDQRVDVSFLYLGDGTLMAFKR